MHVSTVARLTANDLPLPAAPAAPGCLADAAASSPSRESGVMAKPAEPAAGVVRVPALLALPSGRLLLVHDHRPAPRATNWSAGGALPDDLPNPNTLWLRHSDDAGATWSRPLRLVPGLGQAGGGRGEIPPFLRVTGVSDPSLLLAPDGAVHLFAAASTDVGLFGAHPPTRPVSTDQLPEPGTLRLLHAISRDNGETWAWDDLTDLFLAQDRVEAHGVEAQDIRDDAAHATQGHVPALASVTAPATSSHAQAQPSADPRNGREERVEASGVVGFPVSGHGTVVRHQIADAHGGAQATSAPTEVRYPATGTDDARDPVRLRRVDRLVQPVVVAFPARPDGSRPVRAQALVSDDAGATWYLASPIPAPPQESAASLAGGAATSGVDEWAVVGLPGTGELVVSARDGGYGGSRLVSRSQDGGRRWSVPTPEPELPDPGCNGGLAVVPAAAEPSVETSRAGSWALVCSHAADPSGRRHGRLTASWDGGRTWRALADLTGPDEPFAYSDLAWLPWCGPGDRGRDAAPGVAEVRGGASRGTLVIVAEDPQAGDVVCRRLSW